MRVRRRDWAILLPPLLALGFVSLLALREAALVAVGEVGEVRVDQGGYATASARVTIAPELFSGGWIRFYVSGLPEGTSARVTPEVAGVPWYFVVVSNVYWVYKGQGFQAVIEIHHGYSTPHYYQITPTYVRPSFSVSPLQAATLVEGHLVKYTFNVVCLGEGLAVDEEYIAVEFEVTNLTLNETMGPVGLHVLYKGEATSGAGSVLPVMALPKLSAEQTQQALDVMLEVYAQSYAAPGTYYPNFCVLAERDWLDGKEATESVGFVLTVVAHAQSYVVSGAVHDGSSGRPLGGVSISLLPQRQRVGSTLDNGEFRLVFDARDEVTLEFSKLGYKSKTFSVVPPAVL